jgi:hypothetical protein
VKSLEKELFTTAQAMLSTDFGAWIAENNKRAYDIPSQNQSGGGSVSEG